MAHFAEIPDAKASPQAYIESLPSELIRHILMWAKVYDPSNNYLEPPLSVFRSQVSRRWREIALSCQELWSDWPRYGRAEYWTNICYERSLQAPLDLRIIIDEHTVRPSAAAGRKLALEEVSRARTLLVELSGDRNCPDVIKAAIYAFGELSRHDVPWLQSLSLHLVDNRYFHSPEPAFATLFRGEPPPHLQHVSIQDFAFPASDKIWPSSLRTFDMRDGRAWSNVDEMVDFFKAVPNLEELTYQYNNILPRWGINTDFSQSKKYSIRSAPLSRLKRFCLLNDDEDSSDRRFGAFIPGISLFSHCALPPNATLDMSADMLPSDWNGDNAADAYGLPGTCAANFALGTEALRAHFSEAAAHGQSYDVLTVNDRVIKPDLARQVSESSLLPSALTLTLPHVNEQGRRGRVSRIACTMYLSLPVFSGTTELHVTRTRHSQPFLHRFPTFPAVRTMILSRKAAKDFVQAPRFSTCAESFPALEVIRFSNFDCKEYVQPAGRRSRTLLPFDAAMLSTLDECVRAGVCKTWRRIEFEGCGDGKGMVERIRADERLKDFNEHVEVVFSNDETYGLRGGSWSDRSDSDVPTGESDDEGS